MTTTVAGFDSGQSWSPLTRMQNQLQSAVNNGTVQAGDQDALSAALTDISSALQANATGSTGTPAPGSAKSTIDNIISNDVSSGKLTSDQATELKSVFAQAAQKMHGHGGHHHHGGGGMPSVDSDSDTDGSNTDPITGATQTAATSFGDFLQQLETSLADAVNGVTGTSATGTTASATSTTGTTSTSSTSSTSDTSSTDPRQLMLNFLKQLETALSSNTYGSAGGNSATNAQGVLVSALA